MKLPLSQKTDIYFYAKDSSNLKIIEENKNMIFALIKSQNIYFIQDENKLPKVGSTAILGPIKIMIPLPEALLKKEKERLEKQKEKLKKQYLSTKNKLDNAEFIKNAPEEIVKNMQKQFNDLKMKLEEIEKKITGF